ncbi:fibrinogen-like protein A [Saccostrea echinata]|uniref:fibrinogen-like protein A n=1 Tax=Saccostrea echinata TaxID=191078 RepID=UPI002A8400BD|nr:fibrinogen-like protein A [Saccostrea echinata]
MPGFNLLTNVDIGRCMRVCYKFSLCQSVDWTREKKTCWLNTRYSNKNVSNLRTENRLIHIDRENFPEHMTGTCLNHTCSEDSFCARDGNCVTVLKEQRYKDCEEIMKKDPSKKGQDGVYVIYLDSWKEVFCDMTIDGGGWTVIQKREDDDVDFYRTWNEYKHGFGNASKNYWIGNDAIHALTKDQDQELRVDLKRFNGDTAYAEYSIFYIGNEADKYRLTVSGYNGTAGDSLDPHNGMRFSTKDQDNDIVRYSCANSHHGAWWYFACTNSNLNGEYAQSEVTSYKCPYWYRWTNGYKALQRTLMMIRRKRTS